MNAQPEARGVCEVLARRRSFTPHPRPIHAPSTPHPHPHQVTWKYSQAAILFYDWHMIPYYIPGIAPRFNPNRYIYDVKLDHTTTFEPDYATQV